MTKWKLVDVTRDKAVWHIVGVRPIVPILLLNRQGRELISCPEIERFLPGVGEQAVEAVAETLLQFCCKRVVTRPASVVRQQNKAVLRIRHTLLNRHRSGGVQPCNVQVAALRQLLSGATCVFELQQEILHERTLDAEGPLRQVWRAILPVEGERIQVLRSREGRQHVFHEKCWTSGVTLNGLRLKQRRTYCFELFFVPVGGRIVDTRDTADDRIAKETRAVGEADSRGPVVPIRIDNLAANPLACQKNAPELRTEEQALVVPLIRRPRKLVSNSYIEREIRHDMPVVLNVPGPI